MVKRTVIFGTVGAVVALLPLAASFTAQAKPKAHRAAKPKAHATAAKPKAHAAAAKAPDAAAVFARACAGCHGAKLQGGVGPALANEGSKHDAKWLAQKITDPMKLKPNSPMPPASRLNVSAPEVKALAAWLAKKK